MASTGNLRRMTTYTIQGQEIETPFEVREARQWAVQYLVQAPAAQAVIDHTGLQVAQPFPGRAMVSLAFVDYLDTPVGPYHEVAVSFVVRPHDALPARGRELVAEFFRGEVGAFIHQLPVDQTLTLEAGVGIWGFPKFLADIEIRDIGRRTFCELRHDGEHVLTLDVRRSGPVRLPQHTPPSYSFHEGVLRRTEWTSWGHDRGGVVGGAELELGSHPIAKELESLGLPQRALMTSHVGRLRAVFGDAEVVEARPR